MRKPIQAVKSETTDRVLALAGELAKAGEYRFSKALFEITLRERGLRAAEEAGFENLRPS